MQTSQSHSAPSQSPTIIFLFQEDANENIRNTTCSSDEMDSQSLRRCFVRKSWIRCCCSFLPLYVSLSSYWVKWPTNIQVQSEDQSLLDCLHTIEMLFVFIYLFIHFLTLTKSLIGYFYKQTTIVLELHWENNFKDFPNVIYFQTA